MADENQNPTVIEQVKTEAEKAIPKANSVESMTVPKSEKTLAMIGYVTFLCVLPLVLRPQSKFCQFHGKQSLILVILFFILSLITLLSRMVGLAGFFGMIFSVVQMLLIIMGAMNAAKGNMWRIPFVAQVADKLDWRE